MTTERPAGLLREALLQVVKDWGLDDPRSDPPHGWRCQHPELSDPATCGHVDALVDDLVNAAALAATGDSGGPLDVERLEHALRLYFGGQGWRGAADHIAAEYARLSSKGYDKADHAAREGVPESDL